VIAKATTLLKSYFSGKNLTKIKNLKLLNVWNKKEPLNCDSWYGGEGLGGLTPYKK